MFLSCYVRPSFMSHDTLDLKDIALSMHRWVPTPQFSIIFRHQRIDFEHVNNFHQFSQKTIFYWNSFCIKAARQNNIYSNETAWYIRVPILPLCTIHYIVIQKGCIKLIVAKRKITIFWSLLEFTQHLHWDFICFEFNKKISIAQYDNHTKLKLHNVVHIQKNV